MVRIEEEVFLVYSASSPLKDNVTLPEPYSLRVWCPTIIQIIPHGLGAKFGMWWIAHWLRIFRNREYAVVYLLEGDRIVHRSCVIPTWFRWPFMEPQDLQISSTFTDSAYRGKGLATLGLLAAIKLFSMEGRRFWYLTRKKNPASIIVCERAGFQLEGFARRTHFLKLRLLGNFQIFERTPINRDDQQPRPDAK